GATLKFSASTLTLSGSGILTLLPNSVITGASASDKLVNQSTIQGFGANIGNGSKSLHNQGTVEASVDTPAVISLIDTSSAGVTNTGTLIADSGSALNIEGGQLTNFKGTTL